MNIFSHHPFSFNMFWGPGSICVLFTCCLLVTDVNVCLAHGSERVMGSPGLVQARPDSSQEIHWLWMQEAFTTNELKKKTFFGHFFPHSSRLRNLQKSSIFTLFQSSRSLPLFSLQQKIKKNKTLACRYTHAGVTVDLWRQSDKIFWLGRCLTDRNTDQLPH